jgi:hypothetical protein
MTLCSDGHDEVCYECRRCPVCVAKAELAGVEGLVDELRGTLTQRADEVSDLNTKIAALEGRAS